MIALMGNCRLTLEWEKRDWPTIPQLYVNGEFIGGCDIVTSMHENGELKELLQEEKPKD